jgi:hypothetical protein
MLITFFNTVWTTNGVLMAPLAIWKVNRVWQWSPQFFQEELETVMQLMERMHLNQQF